MDIVHYSWFRLDPSHLCVKLFQSWREDNVRFVLLIGCLSLSACAALVTMRLPSLHRKVAHFLPPRRGLTAPRSVRALD